MQRSNDSTSDYTYDLGNRRTGATTTNGSGTIVEHNQTLDPLGDPTTITATRGSTTSTAAYTYDLDGRVTAVCYSTTCSSTTGEGIVYGYDATSNRTQTVRTGMTGPETTNYTYNDDNQVSATTDGSASPLGTFTYNANGQLTQDTTGGGHSYAYNLPGHLVSATVGSSTTTYGYDGEGNRAKATTASDTSSYTWDINNTVPLLTEEEHTGTPADLAYVNAPAAPITLTNGTDSAWYLQDLQVNVTDLLDASGTSLGAYHYEPFGDPVDDSPATGLMPDNPMRFAHEYLDTGSGLYNNRARQYDSGTGRFTSLDPAAAAPTAPYSNNYGYADGNPMTATDPSGMCGWCGLSPVDDLAQQYGPGLLEKAKDLGNRAQDFGGDLVSDLQDDPIKAYMTVQAGAARSVPDAAVQIALMSPNSFVSGDQAYRCYDDFMDGLERRVNIDPDSPWQPVGGVGADIALMFTGAGELKLGLRGGTLVSELLSVKGAETAASRVLPNSGPIARSLGAASRAEMLAKKLKLNPSSPTTRQVLNSLDMSVEDFVAKYRKGSIWGRLGSELRGMTVEEAIQSSSTARKLLIDGRFAK